MSEILKGIEKGSHWGEASSFDAKGVEIQAQGPEKYVIVSGIATSFTFNGLIGRRIENDFSVLSWTFGIYYYLVIPCSPRKYCYRWEKFL